MFLSWCFYFELLNVLKLVFERLIWWDVKLAKYNTVEKRRQYASGTKLNAQGWLKQPHGRLECLNNLWNVHMMNLNLNLPIAAFAQAHTVLCAQGHTNHMCLTLLPSFLPLKQLVISGYYENIVAKVYTLFLTFFCFYSFNSPSSVVQFLNLFLVGHLRTSKNW